MLPSVRAQSSYFQGQEETSWHFVLEDGTTIVLQGKFSGQ